MKKAMKTTSSKIKIKDTIMINLRFVQIPGASPGMTVNLLGFDTAFGLLNQRTAEGISAEFGYFYVYKAADF